MLIFGGVEIPSNRTLLERNGVTNVMLNYWGLCKRGLPKTKAYMVGEQFLPDMKVWVDSGATQADKAGLSKRELEEYAANYEEFVALNYDRIEGWVEFDSQAWGLPRILQNRAAFENDPKMWVVWHDTYSTLLVGEWAAQYQNVAIPGTAIENVPFLSGLVRAAKAQYGTSFHALATAKPDNLRQIPFDTASTLSWISPMRRGETIVWDGSKLVRYPKKMKDQARRRYARIVSDAGLDFEKFVSDDTLEATKVAIWSYLQLEASMDKDKKKNGFRVIKGDLPSIEEMLVDNNDESLYTGLMDLDLGASNNKGSVERKKVEPRDPAEKVNLPVFGFESKTIVDADNNLKEVAVVRSQQSSLRQCNTCFVAANCPAFKPDNMCAFNLPVEVKTREQLKDLLTAIIEMQGQRVAFMRYAEEMSGGYADPNVSQEIDRLFKLVSNMKDLESNKEFVQITASRETSGGVLSAIFGDRASALREMQNPINEDATTRIISESIED
jgi:hypothetical protein